MAEYEMEPFSEVLMLQRWPVKLPAYRVKHCMTQPNWEEGRLLSMHAHLKPGDVLYDVGAEHADLSACYATWVAGSRHEPVYRSGPDLDDTNLHVGGVVLVEGSDKFWPVMRATFAANGLVPLGCWAGFASNVDTPESMRTPSWATPSFTGPSMDGEWPSWADGEPVPHHGFRSVIESKGTDIPAAPRGAPMTRPLR